MTRGDILHPVFLHCCRLSLNKFWEKIFEDLAYGITPYGAYIKNGILNCRTKNGLLSVIIDNDEIQTTYDDVYKMCTTHVNILSPTERIQTQNDFKKLEEESKNSRDNWGDIRKKNVRDLLIDIFVVDMKTQYELKTQQARYLRSMINTAIMFKAINGDNIQMDNNVIIKIDGIQISKGQIDFDLDMYNNDYTETNTKIDIRKTMFSLWEKYITDLRKKIDFYE